jgi:transposase
MLARVAELEAALAAEKERVAALSAERDRLREAYRALQLDVELLRRRMFVAKAERIDTAQLELEFASKLAALDRLGQKLSPEELDASRAPDSPPPAGAPEGKGRGRRRPTGRRDLRAAALPEERLELADPELEGKAERFGWEESYRLMWRRGGLFRLVIARGKYREFAAAPPDVESVAEIATPAVGEPMIATAPLPPALLPRSLATPSLLARIASDKFCDGLPLHRQADRFARLGFPLDRGTMCRWLEELGATCGATVVTAMRDEALRTAFCLATDATGVLVQPPRGDDQVRRPCRRGHFFVQIADADHIFFEYTARETSAAVGEMFRGFSGYVQADAKSVYDILFRPPDQRRDEADDAIRHEVACWSHTRRKAWEAAVLTKDPVAREALARIRRIFQLDDSWRGRPPDEIKSLRDQHLRPHIEAFFAWARVEYERVKGQRGLLRSALGYACRQEAALSRFLDDGRLVLDNNRSERALRAVAVGRKAWLFVGSDDHAQAAGNLLSLVASARLHRLDPEAYLRDLVRVLPHWPRERFLELAPRYWPATRARLDPAQLAKELGPLSIPAPSAPSQQPSSN